MPAIELVSFTDNLTVTQPLSITKPTGLQNGDVLVLAVAADQSGAGFITPSGFTSSFSTQTSGSLSFKVWTKIITNAAGEPANYSFNDNGISAVSTRGVCMAFRNVDTSTPIDVTSLRQANTASTSLTAPSLTTVTKNALVLWLGAADTTTGTTSVMPSGHDTIINPTSGIHLAVGSMYKNPAGSTGTAVGTLSESVTSAGGRIALRPLYPNDDPTGSTDTFTRQIPAEAAIYVDPGEEPVAQTLYPVADTYVNYEAPDTNYGSVTTLAIDSAAPDADAWFKFTIPPGGDILDAKLRFYLTNGTTGTYPSLQWVPTTWDEYTLTANNAPTPIEDIYANIPVDLSVAPVWIEMDVTSHVVGSMTGDVAFALHGKSSNGCEVDSREGANPPELVLARVNTGIETFTQTVPSTAAIYATPYLQGIMSPPESRNRLGTFVPAAEMTVTNQAWQMLVMDTVTGLMRPAPLENWDEDRTIHVIGDIHVGNSLSSRRADVTSDVTTNLTGRYPIIVQTGDLTHNAVSGEITEAKTFMNGLGTPWKIIGGNHDYYSSVTQEQFESTYNTTRNWYEDIGTDIRLIGLSNTNGQNTQVILDTTALNYLTARLSETSRNCIIFCHAPLVNSVLVDPVWPSSNGSEQANRYVVPTTNIETILDTYPNARAWLSGHTHSSLTAPQLMMGYIMPSGGTVFAMNVSAIAYPGKGTDDYARAIATPLVTVHPDRLEVRWRDHKTNGWHTVMGNELTTYYWDR